MDYDRCLPAAANAQRYYDTWYTYPAATAMPPFVRDQDYPSPAPSCSDPSPAPRTQSLLDSYANFPLATFSQHESSIGPLRSARRHATQRQSSHTRRLSLSSSTLRDQDPSLQCPGSQMPDDLLPRTDSPVTRYCERSASTSLPSISPSLYPTTPVSMGSPFPACDQGRRSRARSDTSPAHRGGTRSPSPSSKSTHPSPSSPPGANAPTRCEVATIRPVKKDRHHKHKLCDQDRKAICKYHLDNPNARQEDIGHVFGVERSTISKILKDKDRWLNVSDEDQGAELTSKHRPSKFPEVEDAMLKSLQEWADRGENITDNLIRQRALDIAQGLGMPREKFKGSSGWIENFKHRHEIRRGEWLKANRTALRTSGQTSTVPFTAPSFASYDQQRMHPEVPHLRTRSNAWEDASPQSGDMVIDPALQGSSHVLHATNQSTTSIQHSPTVTYGVPYGSPLLPSREDDDPPTLDQAENALNVLLHYLDTTGQPLCKPQDREVLHHLKCTLFQHASGLPYERPS